MSLRRCSWHGQDPDWSPDVSEIVASPDGTRIAFSQGPLDGTDPDLYLIDPDTDAQELRALAAFPSRLGEVQID